MEIRDDGVVVLPKLKEANPNRASSEVGETRVVSMPQPGRSFASKNASAEFATTEIQALHENMKNLATINAGVSCA